MRQKKEVMKETAYHKFGGNTVAKQALMATKGEIIEASQDSEWGAGANEWKIVKNNGIYQGENAMGKILTELRDAWATGCEYQLFGQWEVATWETAEGGRAMWQGPYAPQQMLEWRASEGYLRMLAERPVPTDARTGKRVGGGWVNITLAVAVLKAKTEGMRAGSSADGDGTA